LRPEVFLLDPDATREGVVAASAGLQLRLPNQLGNCPQLDEMAG